MKKQKAGSFQFDGAVVRFGVPGQAGRQCTLEHLVRLFLNGVKSGPKRARRESLFYLKDTLDKCTMRLWAIQEEFGVEDEIHAEIRMNNIKAARRTLREERSRLHRLRRRR